MRTIPLLFIMLIVQQASSNDCVTAVDSTYKTRMEMLMNQNYLGNIGGQEFEGKRLELLRFSETETEACLQNAVITEVHETYAPARESIEETKRGPASIPSDELPVLQESVYEELIE